MGDPHSINSVCDLSPHSSVFMMSPKICEDTRTMTDEVGAMEPPITGVPGPSLATFKCHVFFLLLVLKDGEFCK